MSQKKASGSTSNGRDSISKRLGIKSSDGTMINAGTIISRQRGSEIYPGINVRMGKDYTLFATSAGVVKFTMRRGKKVVDVIEAVVN